MTVVSAAFTELVRAGVRTRTPASDGALRAMRDHAIALAAACRAELAQRRVTSSTRRALPARRRA